MKSRSDTILITTFYIITGFTALLCLLPLCLVLSGSFTDEIALLQNGYRLLPGKFSINAYKFILTGNDSIYYGYAVTSFTTIIGTVLSLVMTSAIAYPLSLKHLKYRNKITFFVYFTMLFNGGLVPSYLLIYKYLHLRDNILVYILPCMINAFNMLLLRNFFSSMPESLYESAKIDGANDIVILFKIILPVSLPALASVGLFYSLGYWNDWFTALLYINDRRLYSLQYLVMKIQREVDFLNSGISGASNSGVSIIIPTYGVRMATTILTIGPIIFLYPLLQRYFVKGIMIGAIKG
jgi:ABC-type sugar transport system, permease component